MFYVQGIGGQLFNGPLERLDRINGLSRAQRARPIARESEELIVEFVASPQENEATRAYRQMISPDLERGPLYHAEQVMSRPVILINEHDAVADAWRTLRDNRVRQAPVIDANRKLVGIVSERDLLTAIDIEQNEVITTQQRQVREVMNTPVVAAAPITDIRRIAKVMLDQGVDGVPIIDDTERIIGFVSRSDILSSVVTDPPLSLWR